MQHVCERERGSGAACVFTYQPISAAGFSASVEDEGILRMPQLTRESHCSVQCIHLELFDLSPSCLLHLCLHAFGGILNFLGNMELLELEFSA